MMYLPTYERQPVQYDYLAQIYRGLPPEMNKDKKHLAAGVRLAMHCISPPSFGGVSNFCKTRPRPLMSLISFTQHSEVREPLGSACYETFHKYNQGFLVAKTSVRSSRKMFCVIIKILSIGSQYSKNALFNYENNITARTFNLYFQNDSHRQ